ncbi:MAG: sulfotransferase family protein [Lysobacteraceae bacterium]|nr:MAG: sulfotransferase family protein [Xanthomonadaceae bacterium]
MTAATASVDVALQHAAQLLASDPELAGRQADEILSVVRDHPVAQMILGISHRMCGRLERAIELLAPLTRSQPGMPRGQYEYALAVARAGRTEEAIEALHRAIATNPALPQVWLALADYERAVGRLDRADAAYAAYIRHSVRDPALLHAAEALAADRLPEAEAALRAWLKEHPTDVVAIRMLGELAVRVGRNAEALRLFARCLELAPGFREARQHYALVLHRDQQSAKALEQLDLLLVDDPTNPGARTLKAAVLCRLGEYARGIALYEELLRDYPHNARVWMSYGHALKTEGRQAEAIAAYRRCTEEDPGFGEAWWSLANLKTFRFDDDDVARMRAQLARADLDAEHRLHFGFTLGKALEDRADYAESFEHYRAANRIRLEQVPYRAGDTTARVARARQVYTCGFFAARAGCGDPAADPIFIVGLPRSGSTLLEQILSSHSAVEGTMELPEIISMTRALRRDAGNSTNYHEAVATLDPAQFRELGRQYLERTRVQRKSAAPLFIDKMPNNFLHLGLIHLMLPNAKIVDARRHPMACCFSGFKQHFARGQKFSYGLEDLGRYYRDYVELMAHFDTVFADCGLPHRVHRVIHERMVDDTEAEVRRLLDYCGLPFEDACLRFYENDRPVRTASSEQVRRPINRDGIDQWRHYEPWLDPLKAALGPVLDAYPDVPEFATPDLARGAA